MIKELERNSVFDAIKALAIVLVVYGHSIQYLSGCGTWDNAIFRFIYTFHMPLFFMISGFFISSALKLSWKDFLIKKGISLLLPCFIWTIIYSTIHFSGWHTFFTQTLNPLKWDLWFLKGLFWVQLIAYTCMRISVKLGDGKNTILIAILLSLLVYELPFMYVPRVMLPMFWIGYIMHRHYEWIKKYYLWIAIIAIIVFIMLYPFGNSYIEEMYAGTKMKFHEFVVGKTDWLYFYKLIYRITLGAIGSIAILSIMHSIKKISKMILLIGSSTQGIYILQALILETILGTYVNLSGWNSYLLFLVILPLIALLVVLLCTFLSRFIEKNKITGLLLLGKRPK